MARVVIDDCRRDENNILFNYLKHFTIDLNFFLCLLILLCFLLKCFPFGDWREKKQHYCHEFHMDGSSERRTEKENNDGSIDIFIDFQVANNYYIRIHLNLFIWVNLRSEISLYYYVTHTHTNTKNISIVKW